MHNMSVGYKQEDHVNMSTC